ncbi:PREDICTED: cell growth-regulating nucleolar protein [Eufriesea mexicana]|uniref:cell growth-regulating nucleolar protein n=1 Tax=Eufriesea mexicana TaxID=516756 RepID=UPI00083C0547|nr:PREDICTED: cell growth-regulating nucleolar protein [Eufriesea mexicana]
MVVFTCNNCGETLQKSKVAKHYEFQCHTAPFLSCVDCFKDFRGEEYVAHTKCISEAERYGGKDYVPKPGANKGEKKQQEWITIVNSILNSEANLSKAEHSFLNILSKYENIPRKKAKFLNFVKSAMGQRTNPAIIDSVWNKMETAYKKSMQNIDTQNENQHGNGKVDENIDDAKNINVLQENNVVENQNNENIYRENQHEDQPNTSKVNSVENDSNNDFINNIKKKKLKKRTMSEIIQEPVEEHVVKKKNKHEKITENSVSKKKNKDVLKEKIVPMKKSEDTLLSESSINQYNGTVEKLTFNWRDTILDIVKNKREISLKKLQKKVISRYVNSCSNTILEEKASSKFNKKLKKMSEIIISDEKVTLA